MKKPSFNQAKKECYPGSYEPLHSNAEVEENLKSVSEEAMPVPAVNLAESDEAYLFELAVPGVRKEDFLIQTQGGSLIVSLLHNEASAVGGSNVRIHEFGYECFKKTLPLPDSVDPVLIQARYDNGILFLRLPKVARQTERVDNVIAVY